MQPARKIPAGNGVSALPRFWTKAAQVAPREADVQSKHARVELSGFGETPVFFLGAHRLPMPVAAAPGVPVRAKLRVGPVDDPLEHEADRTADQVMRMTEPTSPVSPSPVQISRQCSCGGSCSTCRGATPDGEHKHLQKKSAGLNETRTAASPIVNSVLRSPGQPLDQATRAFMEPRFGRDFSRVRVHADAGAEESANGLNAHAYTAGHNIVFNAGQFAPGTPEGRRLLAHELTHVIQQTGSYAGATAGTIQRAPKDKGPTSPDPYEKLSLKELQARAKADPEAAEALRLRYRAMSDAELGRRAKAGDAMAQSVRGQRIPENTMVENLPKQGEARFSDPTVYQKLEDGIKSARANSGIGRSGPHVVTPDAAVGGGVVGAAKTNVPGLSDRTFTAGSPLAGGAVNPGSQFKPATDPKVLPHTHGHAEQGLADQIHAAFKGIPAEQLEGRTVWILIEQVPCSTCIQGAHTADPNTEPGVLAKLSQEYPTVTFEVKHMDGSGNTSTLRAGKETVVPLTRPKATPPTDPSGTPPKSGAAPAADPNVSASPGGGSVSGEVHAAPPVKSRGPTAGEPRLDINIADYPPDGEGPIMENFHEGEYMRAGMAAVSGAQTIASLATDKDISILGGVQWWLGRSIKAAAEDLDDGYPDANALWMAADLPNLSNNFAAGVAKMYESRNLYEGARIMAALGPANIRDEALKNIDENYAKRGDGSGNWQNYLDAATGYRDAIFALQERMDRTNFWALPRYGKEY